MQTTKNFGETLKELKSINGIKSITLANYLGYDISYISKWCSNKKLPSGRNSIYVIDELARIFSREIINSGKIKKFNQLYKTNMSTVEEIREHIKLLLEDGYDRSKTNENLQKRSGNKVIFGRNEIASFVKSSVYELIMSSKKSLDIYVTLDVLSFDIVNRDEDFLASIMSKVNLKIGCDREAIARDNYVGLYNLHNTLSKLSFCDVKIYDNREFSKANVFMVKDEFAFLYSLNENDKPDFGVMITDIEELDKIYGSLEYKFNSTNILVDTLSEEELKDKKYLFNFYNSDIFTFIFNQNFDFLSPRLMLDNIKVKDESIEGNKEQLDNLEGVIKSKFTTSLVDIFIIKSMLDDYIFSRMIQNSKNEVLELLENMEQLIEYMKFNSDFKLYLVDNSDINIDLLRSKLRIYSGEHFTLIKRRMNTKCGTVPFYVIRNQELLKLIEHSYIELEERRYVKELTIEEVSILLDNYKKLV